MGKIPIAISACLLGQNVRYNGTNKYQPDLIVFLKEQAELIPVCPEIECGLAVPREPMRLEAREGGVCLVAIKTGEDMTGQLTGWVHEKIKELKKTGIRGCVLKARSPSCGVKNTPVFYMDGTRIENGPGLFTRALQERFPDLVIRNEEALQSRGQQSKFLKRILGV